MVTIENERIARAEKALRELELLREFYTAWEFFHAMRNNPSESEVWNKTRLETSAQKLVDAANAVKRQQGLH